MEEQPFLIPIDEPKAEFKKHLELPHNKRILFSAPFGTGKTYFLNEFFKDRPEKVIRLYPVNYSVSSNEDVFELIKFDILFQLLEDDELELKDTDFSFLASTEYFVYYKTEDIIDIFLESLAIINKPLSAVGKGLKKLAKEYSDFLKNKGIHPDKKAGHDYIKERTLIRGSAYENDLVTQLIVALIGRVTENSKQSVLIIDDLDRIDPEHIFRLLNVFAAHFDIGAPDTNKFGFDKVVFVCDITNVRNIFHAKYGTDTDFTGYIDKFYSTTSFFDFNNKWATRVKIEQIVLKADFDDIYITAFGIQKSDNYNWMMLIELLNILCQDNVINIRAIEKISRLPIHSFYRKSKQEDYSANYNKYRVLLLFDILVKLVNDSQKILKSFKQNSAKNHFSCQINSESKKFFIPKYEVYFSNLIIVLADTSGQLVPNMASYIDQPSGIRFNFDPFNSSFDSYEVVNLSMDSDKLRDGKNHIVNLYSFLVRAFEIYQML